MTLVSKATTQPDPTNAKKTLIWILNGPKLLHGCRCAAETRPSKGCIITTLLTRVNCHCTPLVELVAFKYVHTHAPFGRCQRCETLCLSFYGKLWDVVVKQVTSPKRGVTGSQITGVAFLSAEVCGAFTNSNAVRPCQCKLLQDLKWAKVIKRRCVFQVM